MVAQNVLTRICSSSTFTKKTQRTAQKNLKNINSSALDNTFAWYSNKTAILSQFPCDIFPVSQCVNPMWWKKTHNFPPPYPLVSTNDHLKPCKRPPTQALTKDLRSILLSCQGFSMHVSCPFRFTCVGFCKTQKWCQNCPWKNIDARCATHTHTYDIGYVLGKSGETTV